MPKWVYIVSTAKNGQIVEHMKEYTDFERALGRLCLMNRMSPHNNVFYSRISENKCKSMFSHRKLMKINIINAFWQSSPPSSPKTIPSSKTQKNVLILPPMIAFLRLGLAVQWGRILPGWFISQYENSTLNLETNPYRRSETTSPGSCSNT